MAAWPRVACVLSVIMLVTMFVLVSIPPHVAAASSTWTTDVDFGQPGAIFTGTEVVDTGIPAHVDLIKDNIDWSNQAPPNPPAAREGPGLAFSSYDNVAVLFGGYGTDDRSDTWEYDYASNSWTETTADPRPPGREWPGLSYDPIEEVVVLFGGVNYTDGFLNDTWEYDVVTNAWSQQSPPTSPPPLADAPFAYVASAARHVVIGQSLVSGQMVTWAYDAATHAWTNLGPGSNPSPRSGFAVAYHAQRDRVVLFGGSLFMTLYADTWEYAYGGSWTQVSVSGPSARAGHAMTYRPASQSVLLFGGVTSGGASQETWRYTVSQLWLVVSSATKPPPRQHTGFAYDAAHDAAILFGGRSGGGNVLGDTWALEAAYRAAGKYASAVYDSGAANVDWGAIWWNKTPAGQPADTFLRFQIAAADSPSGPFSYVGPDGTVSSYYTSPGTSIWTALDGHEYLRFLGDFGSTNSSGTPSLEDLTISYVIPPAPPYVVFTDPPNAAFGVPVGTVVHVTFSKPVDPSTLAVTFVLGTPVAFVPTWTNGDRDVDLAHPQPFAENEAYQLDVAVKDLLGQDLVAGPVPNPWTFVTEKVNPVVTDTNPIHAQANVPEARPVFVNFSEPMDVASVDVAVTPGIALTPVWSNGNASLRLDHPDFTLCTHYTFQINGTDLAGLPLVPGPTANPWTFTVRCRNPYITETVPSHLGMGVALTADVVVDFSEPMNTTSVIFGIDPPVGSPSLSWSNGDTRLTMSHAAPFTTCGVYTVTVTGRDADEDLPLVQNPFQPMITSPWKFITVCGNPFLFATFPAANATDVPVLQELWIIFSGGMDPATVDWTVTGGPFLAYNVTWDIVMGSYVGVHVRHFGWRQCSRYTILVTGSDGAGRPLVPGLAPNPWSFDPICEAPYVTTTDPANGTTQAPLGAPVAVRFSEPMDASSVIVMIAPGVALEPAWSDGNTTLTLTHAVNFTACTLYTVFVDGLGEDGNSLLVGEWAPAAADPWTFKSWCPGFYINRTDPVDNRTGVPRDANLTVEFSRPADPTALQVTTVPPVPLARSWSDNDTLVTLDPEVALAECTWYTVTVSARAADGSDLINTTLSVPNPWRFKTVCYPPQILSTDPPAGAVDVPLDAPIVVTFSKPMDTTSVTVTLNPTIPNSGAWTDNNTVLTLTHGMTFLPLQPYCVAVAGADWQGNPLVSGPVPNPWCFTTAPPLPPPRGLRVIRAPPDIILTWAPVPGAFGYVVYESADRFAPWPWAQLGSTSATSMIVAGHESDGLPHFYVVRALAGPAVEGGNSTMGAKIPLTFAYRGDRSNVHWLSLPYRSMYRTAKDISDELTSARIDVVGTWDPLTQRPVLWYYLRGGWRGTNFALDPGDGFFVGARASFTWVVNGTDGDVPIAFSPRASPNTQWLSLPYASTYAKASDIVVDIEGNTGGYANTKILEVGKWDAVLERFMVFQWTNNGWQGSDFPTAPGEGIYFKASAPFVWHPRLITPEVP